MEETLVTVHILLVSTFTKLNVGKSDCKKTHPSLHLNVPPRQSTTLKLWKECEVCAASVKSVSDMDLWFDRLFAESWENVDR